VKIELGDTSEKDLNVVRLKNNTIKDESLEVD